MFSGSVLVDTAEGVVTASLRGKLRSRGGKDFNLVAGDRVVLSLAGPAEGALESILPRTSELRRATAGGRPVVIAANVERMLAILAARDPPPRWALVDRMLVAAEIHGLLPAICVNKWDQVATDPGEARALLDVARVYRDLSYPVFTASALKGEGLAELSSWLEGKSTVFSGHSGVGKSTILNALIPGLALRTGDVNPVTGKGRHTTSAAILLKLPSGGYAVDTPGFREFQPAGLEPQELGRSYPEFCRVLGGCRFRDCLHRGEPACAVRAAVDRGEISKVRYDNYLQILGSLTETGGNPPQVLP
jgi:ribosome biogenesis GTPase